MHYPASPSSKDPALPAGSYSFVARWAHRSGNAMWRDRRFISRFIGSLTSGLQCHFFANSGWPSF